MQYRTSVTTHVGSPNEKHILFSVSDIEPIQIREDYFEYDHSIDYNLIL